MSEEQQQSFTHVIPLRNIDVEGERLFNNNQNYEIQSIYQRGNYTIDGEHFHFMQTTLVVVNETGKKTYIPYNSGNFTKVRGVRAGATV